MDTRTQDNDPTAEIRAVANHEKSLLTGNYQKRLNPIFIVGNEMGVAPLRRQACGQFCGIAAAPAGRHDRLVI
ncbi:MULTISPECIES: hypothetical protein [unclassified Sinorhizobium]|uniref:hypothetical protein n=1 Tax=unclassified Sinorhizobium TaxID=2613772 RepID=UPI0035269F89